MRCRVTPLYFVSAVWLMLLSAPFTAFAQFQIQHQAPAVVEKNVGTELTFTVPGINQSEVQDAFLFYKLDGDVAYRQQRANLNQSTFSAVVTINDNFASSLEYYFEIQYVNGDRRTYPENLANSGPIRVDIVDQRTDMADASGSQENIEYTILSPEPGEGVASNDVVLAITLFYDEGAIDTTTTSFELLLDGEDITEDASASEYFLTYVPDRLDEGEHTAVLRLRKPDETVEITSWTFMVVSPGAVSGSPLTSLGGGAPSGFIPSGQVELTARNQVIAGNAYDALSGNVRMSGRQGNIRYTAYGLLTSQEDSRLQPQNRYGGELYVGDWLELQAGHIYPTLSPLTIAGQRVQGVNVALRPLGGVINLQFLTGKLRRGISNLYTNITAHEQVVNDVVVDTTYSLAFESGGTGTFERDIIGGRLGLGRARKFQFGLNILKVEDDTSSIDVVRNYTDALARNTQLASGLSTEDRNKLQSEPDLLTVDGNPRPKGNFVAGTDLMFNADRNRIQFRADGAISLLNDDISQGALTAERADELGFEIDQDVENLLDQLSWLIIINENMSALPLRFEVDGEQTTAEPFFPTSILATESEFSMNYFNNNLRLQYRWVGPDYNSLANSTVRKDIAGFTVTDRFRLLQNRIYVTLGYESLNDNVIDNKEATTNTNTLRANVSWYPIKRVLPRVSMGIMSRKRDNSVDLYNPFVAPSLESAAARNFEVVDGQDVIAPNPRLANTIQFTTSISQQFELWDITHDASINYSRLDTDDELFAYGDAVSNSISLNLVNRFRNLPLDTNFGFTINSTETANGLNSIDIFGFNVGGSMFFLDDKLNVSAGLAFTKNKSEIVPLVVNEGADPNDINDDYYEPDPASVTESNNNSFIFTSGARYTLNNNHAFVVDMRFTNVSSTLPGVETPNDRLIQARYIFSF